MNLLDFGETIYGSRPDLTPEQAEQERVLALAYLTKHAPDLIDMIGVAP